MKIVIDARWTRTDYHDGISRYTAGIVQGFKENNIPITVLIHDEAQLKMLPSDIPYVKINNPSSLKEFFVARQVNKLNPDVVFSPMQIMGFVGRKYKLIYTLHDVIYYRHPKPPTNLPPHIRLAWRAFYATSWPQRFILNRADHTATVSNYSKNAINDLNLTKRGISVVHNASSLDISQADKTGKRTKKIVYMGSFMPYKNVEVIIKGMKFLPKDYTLHLANKISAPRKAELEKLIKASGAKVVYHNGVNDKQSIELLQDAFCLATGSKEEGFGLPVVEAQTLGTPIICSDIDVFKEVAGEGALYFNPDDPSDFAKQVIKLEDPKFANKMIEKGYKQAKKFSWKNSSKKLYDICKMLQDKKI